MGREVWGLIGFNFGLRSGLGSGVYRVELRLTVCLGFRV